MDAKEYRLTLLDIRANLRTLLKDAVTARDGQREKLAAVHALSRDYNAEYLERKLQEVEAEIAASNAKLHQRAQKILENWAETIQARFEQPIELTPELTAAINLVTVAGHQLEHQDLRGLADQFRGSPAALRALRAAFEAQDLPAGVELVRARTYEPGPAMIALQGAVNVAFRDNGSLNAVAVEAWRVFEKEGLEFERTVDQQGVTDALRAGAGLPPLV